MIKIFIPIDKKSVKENPNYDRDRFHSSSTIECLIESPEKIKWVVEPTISITDSKALFIYDFCKPVVPDFNILEFFESVKKIFGKYIKKFVVTDNYTDTVPDNRRYLYKYEQILCPVCNKLCKPIWNDGACDCCGAWTGDGNYTCSECDEEFDEVEFENIDYVI